MRSPKTSTGTEYTECQAFCTVVRIGSPQPLNRKRLLPPPLRVHGGDTPACGKGGGGDLIPTKEQKLWYLCYVCTVIPLRLRGIVFQKFRDLLTLCKYILMKYINTVCNCTVCFRILFRKLGSSPENLCRRSERVTKKADSYWPMRG